jgi:hypothetical protein
VFTIWLLYVWIKDSNFGSQPSCNNLVKYVLFFVDVRATATWLRVLFLLYLVITAFGLLVSIVFTCVKQTSMHNYEKLPNVAAATEPFPSMHPPISQSQEQSKQENDFGRMVRYVNPSVMWVP